MRDFHLSQLSSVFAWPNIYVVLVGRIGGAGRTNERLEYIERDKLNNFRFKMSLLLFCFLSFRVYYFRLKYILCIQIKSQKSFKNAILFIFSAAICHLFAWIQLRN